MCRPEVEMFLEEVNGDFMTIWIIHSKRSSSPAAAAAVVLLMDFVSPTWLDCHLDCKDFGDWLAS